MANNDLLDEEIVDSEDTPTIDNIGTPARGAILLEQQIKMLQDSLDRRSQLPFNPVMMKLAQGFLAPTKTGSFGESLGLAAEGASDAAEKELARKTDVEKLKLELAQKQYELTGDVAGQAMFNEAMSGRLGPKGKEVASLSTKQKEENIPTSTEAPTTPTKEVSPNEAVKIVQNNPSELSKITLTPEIVTAIGATSKKWGIIAQKMYENQIKYANVGIAEKKLQQTNLDISPRGIFNKATGKWEEKTPQQAIKRRNPFDPSDKEGVLVPENLVAEYDAALATGNSDEIKKVLTKIGQPGYVGNKPTEEETTAERETRIKKGEIRYTQDIENNRTALELMSTRADAALDIKNNAQAIYDFAANKDTSGAFGILSKPGFKATFFSALKEPLRIGEVGVGIANIEDLMRKAGGTQKEIDAASAVARNISQLELGFSQMFKGQGQVSDNERLIVSNVGPQLTDSPKVVMLKSEAVMARSDFDNKNSEIYSQWIKNNPDKFVTDYKQSKDYNNLKNSYNKNLGDILVKYGMKSAPIAPASKPSGGGSLYKDLQNEKK